jgi:hypothetical protein
MIVLRVFYETVDPVGETHIHPVGEFMSVPLIDVIAECKSYAQSHKSVDGWHVRQGSENDYGDIVYAYQDPTLLIISEDPE